MSVTGFINEDKLTGGWIIDGLGQPVGQLATPAPKLDERVSILEQAGFVELAKKTRILD